MARGGPRNRSGPQPDPRSARSEGRGLSFDQLPAEGYDGPAPEFPLPPREVFYLVPDSREKIYDEAATETIRERELEVWGWVWRTPQADAWSREPWRHLTVAMWVRTFVVCEGSEATAADKGSLHRFADQIGLTPAGLRENGWTIVAAPAVQPSTSAPTDELAPRRRMRA